MSSFYTTSYIRIIDKSDKNTGRVTFIRLPTTLEVVAIITLLVSNRGSCLWDTSSSPKTLIYSSKGPRFAIELAAFGWPNTLRNVRESALFRCERVPEYTASCSTIRKPLWMALFIFHRNRLLPCVYSHPTARRNFLEPAVKLSCACEIGHFAPEWINEHCILSGCVNYLIDAPASQIFELYRHRICLNQRGPIKDKSYSSIADATVSDMNFMSYVARISLRDTQIPSLRHVCFWSRFHRL